jgi:hypothetical protein
MVGPIAQETAQEAVRTFARDNFGDLVEGDLSEELLDAVQDAAERRIGRLTQTPFLEPNRFAYLLVEVEPDGVRLIWKGIPPMAAEPTDATMLYEAHVAPQAGPLFGLPCVVFPLLVVGAAGMAAAVGRRCWVARRS